MKHLKHPEHLKHPLPNSATPRLFTPKKYSIVSSEHNHRFFAKIEAAPKVINPKKQLQPNLVVLNSLNHESNKLNEFEILKNMLNYL